MIKIEKNNDYANERIKNLKNNLEKFGLSETKLNQLDMNKNGEIGGSLKLSHKETREKILYNIAGILKGTSNEHRNYPLTEEHSKFLKHDKLKISEENLEIMERCRDTKYNADKKK